MNFHMLIQNCCDQTKNLVYLNNLHVYMSHQTKLRYIHKLKYGYKQEKPKHI